MNVLLVVIDTQRADHLSCYGYGRETSPHLDLLARDGILFKRCLTNTAHTMPSFTTLITGQYPTTHDIVGTLWGHPDEPDQRLSDETPVLAQVLRQAGWLTAAFDNLLDFGCRPAWFARGFDWYVNTPARDGQHCSQVLAEDINARLLPWLRANAARRPWFCFVHYWDPHQAYNQPEPYRSLHAGGPQPPLLTVADREFRPAWGRNDRLDGTSRHRIDLYDGELSYVDNAIGHVLALLREEGVYDETAVIVTADHGEDLQEHNAPFEHREPYQTTVHVPLILKAPAGMGLPRGTVQDALVGHIDLMPSVLDLLGVHAPAGMDGSSWLPVLRGEAEELHEALFCTGGVCKDGEHWRTPETAVCTPALKYIRRGNVTYRAEQPFRDYSSLCAPPWRAERPGDGRAYVDYFNALPRQELYVPAQDPGEQTNLAGHPAWAAQMSELDARLTDWAASNPRRIVLA